MVMNQMLKPVGSAYKAGKRLYRGHTAKDAEKQMKKKNFGNEFKERKENPHFSKSTEEVVKEQVFTVHTRHWRNLGHLLWKYRQYPIG